MFKKILVTTFAIIFAAILKLHILLTRLLVIIISNIFFGKVNGINCKNIEKNTVVNIMYKVGVPFH